jgi:multiple sugar transport system substrate-binding protein
MLVLLVCVAAAFVAAGCGSSADSAQAGVPTIGFMTWRDQTGVTDKLYRACERESGNAYRIEPVPMGPSVDAAREQLTRRLAAGDTTIDMLNLDVIWTAEFSDAGWLLDLTERVAPLVDDYAAPAVESTFYKNKYWAMPSGTNAALLYYRTDLIKTPPSTWEELSTQAKRVVESKPEMAGFVFQGAPYEGGTVDALEFILAGGASVLDEDGAKAALADGDGAEHALAFLKQLMDDNVAPKVVTTYQEEDARLAFQNGDAVFMRNWPYAYALMNDDESSKVKGKFDVVPLPAFEGRSQASILGGQNFGIAASSDQPELAWKAIECLTSKQSQKQYALKKGELPTLTSLYDDPDLQKKFPFLQQSLKALGAGTNRPISPYYNDITLVIYKAYNDVLGGRITPEAAVARMQEGVQAAVDGKPEI